MPVSEKFLAGNYIEKCINYIGSEQLHLAIGGKNSTLFNLE